MISRQLTRSDINSSFVFTGERILFYNTINDILSDGWNYVHILDRKIDIDTGKIYASKVDIVSIHDKITLRDGDTIND